MRRLWLMVPVLFGGCGVSVHVQTRTTTSTNTPTGNRSFSSHGMALHFTYPATFSPGKINSIGRKLERDRLVTRAALETGAGGYDLLLVPRYAQIARPVSAGNIHTQKPRYDQGLSKIFGRRMVGTVGTVAGLPALSYTRAPTPGVPVAATTRATFVFVGPDEYELQCQWTPAERTAVAAACAQMLRTLHT